MRKKIFFILSFVIAVSSCAGTGNTGPADGDDK